MKSADRFLRKKDEMNKVIDSTLFVLTRKARLLFNIAQHDGRPELMILVYC